MFQSLSELFKREYVSTDERLISYVKRISKLTIMEFKQDRCMREANAMAYRTLLSLVPLFAIFLWVFTYFGMFDSQRDKVIDSIYYYFVPSASEVVKDTIVSMASNAKALSTFGILGLFLAAIYLFNAIEETFNRIWGLQMKRTLITKIASFTGIILFTPVLAGLSLYMTAWIQKNIRLDSLEGVFGMGIVNKISVTLFPVIFMWAALTIIFMVVPNTKVRLRPAIIGALCAAILVEVIKLIVNWYMTRVITYNILYGGLGAIPILLISIYVMWLVILLGAEVAYAIQCYHFSIDSEQLGTVSSRTYLAITIMMELTNRCTEGLEQPSLMELARKLRVGLPQLTDILQRLKDKDIISVQGSIHTETFQPAKDPSKICMIDILDAAGEIPIGAKGLSSSYSDRMDNIVSKEELDYFQKLFTKLEDVHEENLGNLTLSDIVEEINETREGLTNQGIR